MDDDDFGGFEAAVTFEGEDGETQTISPAIPWAAFPAVSEVHVPQNISSDVLLERSLPSACLVPSDSFILSGDDVLTAVQTSESILNPAVLKEQVQLSANSSLDISIPSLSLTEGKPSEKLNVGDSEKQVINGSKKYLQLTVASLEIKLKDAEEERYRIKKELEDLMEKHSILQTDFLKEKEGEFISHQDRYKKLQEKHKLELEDMRKAGHEALTIIVEEFKALLQSTVQKQEEAIEKQYVAAIEKHSYKCEELLNAQHQKLLDMLDTEKEVLTQKVEEALMQQSQKHKEALEKCLGEQQNRSKEALAAAAKIEKEVMQEAILKAVEKERRNMEKIHAEEREIWQAECAKDKEKIAQAVQEAVQEQRKTSQEVVKAAIMEEQKRSEKAVEEAVKKTREELMEYIKEQKRSSHDISLFYMKRLKGSISISFAGVFSHIFFKNSYFFTDLHFHLENTKSNKKIRPFLHPVKTSR
ncbi:coiled-coil domain-containing protein 91 isoform X2 [Dermochelys coriacea]|uniref:coiled-coil domain-containing protein 91 isoform X2 n=1 Tax=Dermochelys coriacea TaxID=27794 RepID=UPI001CA83363|nr:coiled-coil domain-containing protein 91 isoform X2 [Dermochelys coriacea]XP_043370858.1 coiled-coil domain-containing protein 91 isoform X2 [Dermochelys coriacea]XP_043370862.1 coiled-coil domain-containing protein 91 isoform X2 [Dermochelys coriacea]XP_043370866.1 coiled-coil domain-containing protein 91 isoform X2 [Dermochelys coriacea]XP_043370869.1 coiled-coil domain-containing protein 91 isoform X2 [Dermochelys coriacea]